MASPVARFLASDDCLAIEGKSELVGSPIGVRGKLE